MNFFFQEEEKCQKMVLVPLLRSTLRRNVRSLNSTWNLYAIAALSTSGNSVAFKLADIGEGIAEVELMKWFVKVPPLLNQLSDIVLYFASLILMVLKLMVIICSSD